MALEIERKWLVDRIPTEALGCKRVTINQGYIVDVKGACLRVRTSIGETCIGYVTVKGPNELPNVVEEHEMEIPFESAETILNHHQGNKIKKVRTHIPYGELTIELDVFHGELDGLIIAEVEFPSVDYPFTPPSWFGKEVTGDKRYTNARMARKLKIPKSS